MEAMIFRPGPELTFKSVVPVRAQLYHELMADKGDSFCLDLSQVMHCDTAGLALLFEAKKLCKKNNKHFTVIGISADVHSLAEFCGVTGIFESELM